MQPELDLVGLPARRAAGISVGRMVFMAESGFEIGDWPHLEAWAARLKGMSGFALLYDLIPSKDREFSKSPHYSPK
jgi:hypothetical protein